MSRFTIHSTETLEIFGQLAKVPHTTDLNLQIIQVIPCASNPREQVILNNTLPSESLKNLGRVLLNEI